MQKPKFEINWDIPADWSDLPTRYPVINIDHNDIFVQLELYERGEYAVWSIVRQISFPDTKLKPIYEPIGWAAGKLRSPNFLYVTRPACETDAIAAAFSDVPAESVYMFDEHYWGAKQEHPYWEKCGEAYFPTFSNIDSLVLYYDTQCRSVPLEIKEEDNYVCNYTL